MHTKGGNMELPKMEVIEVHYFTVLIKDEFRPNGQEWITQYETKEEAEEELRRFREAGLAQ